MSLTQQYSPYEESIRLLNKTRELIDTKGWGQGNFYVVKEFKKCNYCLSGALIEACCILETNRAAYNVAIYALNTVCDLGMIKYNDHIDRSKEDILSKIDEAVRYIG